MNTIRINYHNSFFLNYYEIMKILSEYENEFDRFFWGEFNGFSGFILNWIY